MEFAILLIIIGITFIVLALVAVIRGGLNVPAYLVLAFLALAVAFIWTGTNRLGSHKTSVKNAGTAWSMPNQ